MAALRLRFRERALADADQLEAALAANDRSQAEKVAHGLAGTAGIFGYRRISEAAAAADRAFASGRPDAASAAGALVAVVRRELASSYS